MTIIMRMITTIIVTIGIIRIIMIITVVRR
jgi:hypothetical protein